MATDLVMVPLRHHAAAAGRQYARRLFLCAAVAALAGTISAAAAEEPQVAVTEAGGVYSVAATFSVPHSAEAARTVLMDFERIPTYMPDMKTSTVLERSSAGTLVEQEAVARFMMFSKRVHLLLRVHEDASGIRFRDQCGGSFVRYEGAWLLETFQAGTQIAYQLHAKPSFEVPAFVLKRLLKRDATQLIDRIKTEIGRRVAGQM